MHATVKDAAQENPRRFLGKPTTGRVQKQQRQCEEHRERNGRVSHENRRKERWSSMANGASLHKMGKGAGAGYVSVK